MILSAQVEGSANQESGGSTPASVIARGCVLRLRYRPLALSASWCLETERLMFETLSERLNAILDKLTRKGALSEADVAEAMREVRRALLEADVALDVVRDFVDSVKAKAVGQEVVRSVTPGQMVIKIVNDELVRVLGSDAQGIDLAATPPVVMMLVGLQGSGKTTTTAKLGKRLQERDKQKVLMASLDTRRPAAQEQLRVLGEQTGVATLPIVAGEGPTQIAARALKAAKLGGYDVLLLDTAGRTHIDEELMAETAAIEKIASPHETLLVADALTGQDAVNLAKSFDAARGADRHRADEGRRRRARRRGAVDARRHRQADQADRHRREARRTGGVLPRPHRRPHPRHGRRDRPGREGDADRRARQGAEDRRQGQEGRFRPRRPRRAAQADAEARRHGRRAVDAARHRQDQEAARHGQARRPHLEAPAGDDRLDDPRRAQEPEAAQCLAQEARGGRLRHERAGHQPAGEDASADGRHDEDRWARSAGFLAACSAAVRRPRCRPSFPPACRKAACLRFPPAAFPASPATSRVFPAGCRAASPDFQVPRNDRSTRLRRTKTCH